MRRIKSIILIALLLIGLTSCKNDAAEMVTLAQAEPETAEETTESTNGISYIFVYVCGAVNRAGVYELPNGSRVYEAIEMAGGFREDANVTGVNQAEVLEDEEQIYVPTMEEQVESVFEETFEKDGKININKASKEELMTLPGVGESRAESIIKYREEQGMFQNIEDIMQVSGIKEGLFEKIKDLITI